MKTAAKPSNRIRDRRRVFDFQKIQTDSNTWHIDGRYNPDRNELKIGLRTSKIGKARPILKAIGFLEMDPAQINNRNGFNFQAFIKDQEKIEEFRALTPKLKSLGFEGIALFITERQWEINGAMTDKQWQDRIII